LGAEKNNFRYNFQLNYYKHIVIHQLRTVDWLALKWLKEQQTKTVATTIGARQPTRLAVDHDRKTLPLDALKVFYYEVLCMSLHHHCKFGFRQLGLTSSACRYIIAFSSGWVETIRPEAFPLGTEKKTSGLDWLRVHWNWLLVHWFQLNTLDDFY
jgi:hypothetical protein